MATTSSNRDDLKDHMKHDDVPLPPKLHIFLTAADVGKRDVFVIGDLHGCLDELQELLQKAGVTPDKNLIIFVGDLVDKGPKNMETLNFVRDLTKQGACAVRGNHEENVTHQWNKFQEDPDYKPDKSYYDWVKDLSQADIDFLMGLSYTLSIPSLNAIVVHAGLVPGRKLEKQYPIDMVTMRNLLDEVDDDGCRIATDKTDEGSAWAPLWPGPVHVYFGHNASRGLQKEKFATGIDTACYKGGELTGIFVGGPRASEIVSVKAKEVYYK